MAREVRWVYRIYLWLTDVLVASARYGGAAFLS